MENIALFESVSHLSGWPPQFPLVSPEFSIRSQSHDAPSRASGTAQNTTHLVASSSPDGDTNQRDWLKNRWNEFTSNKHGDYTNMLLNVFTNFDFFSFPITKSLRTGITVRANIFLCRWSKKHLETGRTCLKLESTNPKFAIVSTYTCPFPRPVDDYNPCLVSLYLPNRYWSYLILSP